MKISVRQLKKLIREEVENELTPTPPTQTTSFVKLLIDNCYADNRSFVNKFIDTIEKHGGNVERLRETTNELMEARSGADLVDDEFDAGVYSSFEANEAETRLTNNVRIAFKKAIHDVNDRERLKSSLRSLRAWARKSSL